jgi:hypothetical protein
LAAPRSRRGVALARRARSRPCIDSRPIAEPGARRQVRAATVERARVVVQRSSLRGAG